MANDLQIKRRLDVVKNKMTELLRHLASQMEQGVIKSPSELQQRVYHDLQAFYESIGKSSFKQTKAWGAPYSSDHNDMTAQILEDLFTLYAEINNMTEDIKANYEQVELERQSFTKRIDEIQSLVKNVSMKIQEDLDLIIFRDDFSTIDHYKKEGVIGIPAYLSSDERLLTLNRLQGEEFSEYANATIIKGDGLPGNTHVIHSIGDSLKFDGEEEMHINLAHILDNNSDTWFEYEIFEITEQTERITEGKDFRYREAIDWVKKDIREMRCVIRIELPKARNMNWISFSPYIPSDRGALPATIEKIVVSDEKGDMKGMGFEESFDSGQAYIFPKQNCKTITIYLRQDTAYPVMVGHTYFKEINQEDTSIFDKEQLHSGIRVHGVNPSIENLGVSYDSRKTEIIYPIYKFDDTIENENTKKLNLFTAPEISSIGQRVLSGIEQVQAYRYMIGLRDIQLASYQFSKNSQYVSHIYHSPRPIQEVSLDAIIEVPDVFGEGDWVQFFISVNEGRSWHEIHMKDIYRQGVKTKYLFNAKTPKEGRLEEVGYIETADEVLQIQLKIEMTRPPDMEDSNFYTPVVYEYELQALA